MKIIFSTFIFILFSFFCNAQINSNLWLLSNNNIIEFDPEPKVKGFVDSEVLLHREGAAIVTNSNGELLFAATSSSIYNKDWVEIENGSNLERSQNDAAAQSPVILQDCHLVCEEFQVLKEIIFEQTCDQIFDNSNLEENLLLHYDLDGNTQDSGPNMINGINNGAQIDSDRFDNQNAYSFDGNSNVIIPHDDSYKVQFPVSVSTWVKWESAEPNKNGVFNTNFEQDNYHGVFMLRLSDSGKLFFGYGTGTGGITLLNRRAIISEKETELDEWYHIVGIIRGPNDFELFIDGCEEAFTYTGDENPVIAYTDNNGYLGRLDNLNTVPSNDLIGAIDDFYFWNRSIAEEEVLYLYDRFEVPELALNETYTILEGQDDITIELANEYTNVTWSDGQSGNSGTFSEEGTYQVEAFYDCHLVCEEFQVVKEIIFDQTCDQIFDNSNLEDNLLLKIDFTDPIYDSSNNNISVLNTDVEIEEDRLGENSAGSFGLGQVLFLGNQDVLKPNFPMSFSFWVKQNETGIDKNYIYTSDLQLDKRAGFAIAFGASNNKLSFFYSDENGCYNPSCRRQITTSDPIASGEWVHLSIVVKGPNESSFYVDGCEVPIEYSGTGALDLYYTDKPSYVGFADNSNVSNSQRAFFTGEIDDFYFWNRSITEEEVRYLYDRFEVPELELNDTYTILEGQDDDITIELSSEYTDVAWSDGQSGNSATFSEEGTYQVEAFYDCHLVCEEFEVISSCPEDVVLMELFTICEGENLTLNNEVYTIAGSYQQIVSSTSNCDTILQIELEIIENTFSEETYIIHSGEILDINGISYDMIGQYVQDLIGINGCDSTLIINILKDEELITFDFDDCNAIIQSFANQDYSEFIPFYHTDLECGTVTSSNIYREDSSINMHSCTEGLNNSYSMCISSDPNCDFDENSTKKVRMDIQINPNPNSEVVISGMEFFQQAPETFDWINGDDGPNNYPTKFALIILKNGAVIYNSEDNQTTQSWHKESFAFLNDMNFVFTEPALLEIQLLSYCPIGVDSPVTAWDLEDLKIFGSCATQNNEFKVIAGSVMPYANEILEGVQIFIEDGFENKEMLTNNNGNYIAWNNLSNQQYKVTAFKNDDHLKGVSTIDYLVLLRYLLGLQNFDSPLQYIAADINNDGKVSVDDLIILRKVVLGIYTEFPSNHSYKFLNKTEILENFDPWKISEKIDIENLSNHILNADFVPIKIGDVYGQGFGNSSTVQQTESLNIIELKSNIPTHSSLRFDIDQTLLLHGIHFSIDLNGLGLLDIETSLNHFSEENYNLSDDGILNISWAEGEANPSSHLFTLNLLEQDQNGFSPEIIKSEVYTEEEIYNLEPNFGSPYQDEVSISNLIVYPNPINTESIITFDHSRASKIIFIIQDMEGKIVYKEQLNSAKGNNEIPIPNSISSRNSGVFIVRLIDQYSSLLEKIIIAN